MNQPESTSMKRRTFLAAATGAAMAAATTTASAAAPAKNKICVFTKPFQSLSYDELADRIAEMGFDGIEATIRDGGHIEPHEVPDELPKMVEALKARGLEITIMTSSINNATDKHTESVLKTAASLGIERYRMKYFKYDPTVAVAKQLKQWKPIFADLAALNGEIGILGLYQNHAGDRYLGSPIWDIAKLLQGIPKEQIAVAYDIRHATAEGGMSWPTTFRMIQPKVDTVYVKDFVWPEKGNRPTNVPLGEGRVDSKFFKMLRDLNFTGPISLHEEYLDHRKPELVPNHLAACKRDLAVLKDWLGREA